MAKIGIIRNGCLEAVSLLDFFVNQIQINGHTRSTNVSDSEFIVYMTCGGTGKVLEKERKDLETILMLQKTEFPDLKLIVVGCYNRIDGMTESFGEFVEKYFDPEKVHIINDPNWITPTLNYIENSKRRRKVNEIYTSRTTHHPFFDVKTNNISIGLSITKGCNNACTFCKTHYMDMSLTSLPFDKTKKHLEDKIRAGGRIITLHGDNVTAYGIDEFGRPILHELVRDLTSHEELLALDLAELTVPDMYPELKQEIISNPKVRRLSLQLESASNRILKLMNRGHTIEEYTELLNELRQNPNTYVDTIIMSGFPTETEEDIIMTLDYLEEQDIFCNIVARYENSEYLPSGNLKQLSKKDSYEHTLYAKRRLKSQIADYIFRHTKDVNEGTIIARKDNATVFDIGNAIVRGISYKKKYQDLPLGTTTDIAGLKLVKRNAVLDNRALRI